MEWIISNAGTIFVLVILLIVICLNIKSMIKKKKSGKNSCGLNCANCHHAGNCH